MPPRPAWACGSKTLLGSILRAVRRPSPPDRFPLPHKHHQSTIQFMLLLNFPSSFLGNSICNLAGLIYTFDVDDSLVDAALRYSAVHRPRSDGPRPQIKAALAPTMA